MSYEGEEGGGSERGWRLDYMTRQLEMLVFDESDLMGGSFGHKGTSSSIRWRRTNAWKRRRCVLKEKLWYGQEAYELGRIEGKSSNPPFKRLSDAELQLKKEKGLCFRCDEKYTVGHRCKNKELQVLLIQEGEEWEVEDVAEGETSTEETNEVGEVVELSLNFVVGLTPSRTMKVKGKIFEQEVVILIDCGASHNFISTEMVQKLGLPRTATTGYGVIVGTGLVVQDVGMCKGVMLETQHMKIKDDFLPLELGSSDVILGMKWLATNGGMQMN
ncbi:Retrotrans gag domain-containing protein [Abeliophyllum distichum]|uniref:Retrotrans gag domain-containing protein n=1 Tax=Abeliophyllum distichum TaxID=126358 RepID=A0ABD1QH17_9LAMI